MTANQLREARKQRGWNQTRAAAKLGVSQPYLALLEAGRRRLTPPLQAKARSVFRLGPEALPLPEEANWSERLDPDFVVRELGGLGYPGYAAAGQKPAQNPAELLLRVLAQTDLEPRLVEALPWLLLSYRMDWAWLLPRVKVLDLQNRLGFLVNLARSVANQQLLSERANELAQAEARLANSKLAASDSFRRTTMTRAEQQWLQEHRPTAAQSWNVLSDVSPEHLEYGS